MPISSGSENSDEETGQRAVAGGPPNFGHIEFNPDDPKQVRVHYDVSAWSFDHRAELAEVLAEMSVPHIWEGNELVVPEELEEPIDLVFEALEAELGPFPVELDDGATEVVYELEEWPTSDITAITEQLVADQIPHRWEEQTLLVGPDDEERIDELLDRIEADSATEPAPPAAPTDALEEMYKIGRRLAKNPLHPKARKSLFTLAAQLPEWGAPDGLEPGEWTPLTEMTTELRAEFDADDPDTDRIETLAGSLGDRVHQWV